MKIARISGVSRACIALGLICLSPRFASAEDKKAEASSVESKKGSTPAARRKKTATPAVTVNVPELIEKLKSSDSAEVQKALAEAKAAGKGALPVSPAIEELLHRGTSAELIALALAALGEIGAETSAATIQPYTHHRIADIRKKALGALIKTGGPSVVASLREALSDSDAGVRGVAASGLGSQRGHEALGDLFVALDHQVAEAGASIGQLCSPEECEKFLAKTGTLDLDIMTSGFDQMLWRPSTEVSDEQKIRVVERVRDLATQEANKYLRDLQSRWPANGSPRVRQAIEQAVLATSGSKS
jgi:hypothetical protein